MNQNTTGAVQGKIALLSYYLDAKMVPTSRQAQTYGSFSATAGAAYQYQVTTDGDLEITSASTTDNLNTWGASKYTYVLVMQSDQDLVLYQLNGDGSVNGNTRFTSTFSGAAPTTVGQCNACAAGTYSSNLYDPCSYCDAGACLALACSARKLTKFAKHAGTYSAAGATVCTVCSFPYYQPDPGQSACISCPWGQQASPANQAECVDCQAGFATGTQPGFCTQCTGAFYSESTGLSACSDCVNGGPGAYYTSSTENTNPDCPYTCNAGYYRDTSQCQPCSYGRGGYYGTTYGATSPNQCLPCQPGKYLPELVAGTACWDCPQDNYCSSQATAIPVNCEPPPTRNPEKMPG